MIHFLLAAVVLAAGAPAMGGDWAMWRHDGRRSATTDEKLAETLHLQWVIELPRTRPAWPKQAARGFMSFDVSYKPIVLGKRMFVGSPNDHSVRAWDTDTGKQLWRFFADGPVRFAPVGWKGKVYFVSDDGWLYCLDAETGKQKWRVLGGADNRKIIGSGKLVSLWPARGGAVLGDGTIYFGASIWPFVGSFIRAVDAENGKCVWTNSGTGADFQPAYSLWGSGLLVRPGMYGNVPQGYLVVADKRLGVPQGRNVAQLYDRLCGEMLWHKIYGMHVRHDSSDYWFALTAGRDLFSGRLGHSGVNIDTARISYRNPVGDGITSDKVIYRISGGSVSGRSAAGGDRYKQLWKYQLKTTAAATRGPGSYIKAGDNLYAPGANGNVLVVKDVDTPRRTDVAGPKLPGGEVWEMLAADGKLLVVTKEGKIACYGAGKTDPKTHALKRPTPLGAATAAAKAILKATGQKAGYCLVLGLTDGKLTSSIVAGSEMYVIAIDPDAKKVAALRDKMSAAGLYGKRISVHVGDPLAFGLPPYLANLIVSEKPDAAKLLTDAASAKVIFRSLRPYGGVACLTGALLMLKRAGAPVGAAEWSHNNANAANAMMTFDKLVKPPLGVLWFGGPSNAKILPRHGRGPTPTVVSGRMVIEGPNVLRSIDIYTGRMLWERELPNIGQFYNTGSKQLGTHETGPNYACDADGVYVITPKKCLKLNPETGETIKEFALPKGVKGDSSWATVRVDGGVLVATGRPVDTKKTFAVNAPRGASGKWLAAFDAETGKGLWVKSATYGFRSSGVAVSGGKIYCIDGLSAGEMDLAKRRGVDVTAKATMSAFDAKTGKQIWTTDENIFGTWLGYSAERDMLVQAGCGRGSEPTALAGHSGKTGRRVWRCPEADVAEAPTFIGPPLLHHDVIFPQHGQVVGLMDGKLQTRTEPITGRAVPWTSTAHGCGFMLGGEHILTQRAWSTGGYTSISSAPRVFGLGGFRSGCTANMVPAGGVLAAPEYSQECECQFKNKTSLGLIHMPDMENWSFEMGAPEIDAVTRLGLNFGAPGDRQSDEGTLWLDCPDVGGPSPLVSVDIEPKKQGLYRTWVGNWRRGLRKGMIFAGGKFHHHTTVMTGKPHRWITGSGIIGATGMKIAKVQPGIYTVRMYFAEPAIDAKPGDRIFSVTLQDAKVLSDFDVAKESGAPLKGIVKEFKGVKVEGAMTLKFTAGKGKPIISGLEFTKTK
jgi:outer membrane protein assembly factor BamB